MRRMEVEIKRQRSWWKTGCRRIFTVEYLESSVGECDQMGRCSRWVENGREVNLWFWLIYLRLWRRQDEDERFNGVTVFFFCKSLFFAAAVADAVN